MKIMGSYLVVDASTYVPSDHAQRAKVYNINYGIFYDFK